MVAGAVFVRHFHHRKRCVNMMDSKALLQQLRLDNSSNTAQKSPRLWPVAIGSVLAGALAWQILASSTQKPSVDALDNVSSITAPPESNHSNTTSHILNASGYITARQIATVSAQVMGLLVSVDVEEGMSVEKGQVLARIDDSQARIAFDLAKTRVATQESVLDGLRIEYADAVRELQRLENLKNFSSESQLTRAQTHAAKLRNSIRRAETELTATHFQVAQQQSLLHDYVIRAPFAGIITGKNAQAGEIIAPSSAGGGFTRTGICTIVDMDSLEIQVDVNEAYIGRVYQGQPVAAVLDAYPDWKIPARVITLIPTADRAKATVRVRIRILEKSSKILPEMGVKVSFLAGGTEQ